VRLTPFVRLKETLAWYERNRHITREERMIEIVDRGWETSIKAESLLGQWKSVKAVPSLVKRLARILASESQSVRD
jgi:hypothetical protein